MKARLAKKLTQTSLDRLTPYWINKFVCTDGRDARFEKAFAKYNKRNNKKIKTTEKRKRTQNFLLKYICENWCLLL